ncbi:MAG: ribonuclease E activity regulator RraA [Aeromicrobium sp.]|uniref:ribonuclease E activity regulator RraA n=1 Tax=Aeromicrobium sp. TaxID=1871063 RepID=UPI0039E509F4
MSWTTPDLYDELRDEARVLAAGFLDYGGREVFSGPVRTARCLEDNSRVKELLATPGDGAVLVVDGAGSLTCALLGDMIAAGAVEQGWAGVVIAGAVRDVEILRTLDLGVRALGSIPRPSTRQGRGEVDVPVTVGGVRIEPGDVLYADATGLLVTAPR